MKLFSRLWLISFLGLCLGISYSVAKLCPDGGGGIWVNTPYMQIDATPDDVVGNVGSVEDCKDECKQHVSCMAIDYSHSNLELQRNCQLYNQPGPLVSISGVTNSRLVCQGDTTAEPETSAEPESSSEPEAEAEWAIPEGEEIREWILENPEYTAMIGMALMIVLLVVTAICLICCLSGRPEK